MMLGFCSPKFSLQQPLYFKVTVMVGGCQALKKMQAHIEQNLAQKKAL